MLGGGPYEATTCPECGSTIWNGRCENPDCNSYSSSSIHPSADTSTTAGAVIFFPSASSRSIVSISSPNSPPFLWCARMSPAKS